MLSSPVVSIVVVLTYDCNLRCHYCFEREKRPDTLESDQIVESVLDIIRQMPNESTIINFIGGEPCLAFDVMAASVPLIMRGAESAGKHVSLTLSTNGTLLDANKLKHLRRFGYHVKISLDGLRVAHQTHRDGFDLTFTALKACLTLGIDVNVHMVVTNETVHYLAESVAWLRSLGVKKMGFSYTRNNRNFIPDTQIYSDQVYQVAAIVERDPSIIIDPPFLHGFKYADNLRCFSSPGGVDIYISPDGTATLPTEKRYDYFIEMLGGDAYPKVDPEQEAKLTQIEKEGQRRYVSAGGV